MSDEPMPHLVAAQHRGHTLEQDSDGRWTCSCSRWGVPPRDAEQEPRIFGSWMLHASGTIAADALAAGDTALASLRERGVWDYERGRFVTRTELTEAVKKLAAPPQ